jgi:anthranilate phosphoribosyltransferase
MESQEKKYTALQQGVKLIGIGKHGSKKLPDALILDIEKELIEGQTPAILIGAFVGALMMKDIEPSYLPLENYFGKGSLHNPALLLKSCCPDVPPHMTSIGHKLLCKEVLNYEEAHELGLFLVSDEPGESFRGVAVSILRIRYEDDAEYRGLYDAIEKSSTTKKNENKNKNLIQLAEPFDGVEHSYMITPLLANNFQKNGYTAIAACSRNSGPKLTLNTWDIYHTFPDHFIKKPESLTAANPPYGWAWDQADFYPNLEKWIDRRRIIMKRPFLATLEKVLNPLGASILITSVFHIPYMEKMIWLADMAGFEAVIVLKRGLEGSLAPALAKAGGLLCAAKNKQGEFLTQTINLNEENKPEIDLSLENISVEENSTLIKEFAASGKTSNPNFDLYCHTAFSLYNKGLSWIKQVQQE